MLREGVEGSARTRIATLAAAAVATLAIAACGGGGDGESEQDRVRATIEGVHEDIAAGDLEGVCAAMSDRPKRQIGTVGHGRKPTTCERDLRDLVRSLDFMTSFGEELPAVRRATRPEIAAVEISGNRAVAKLTLSGHPLDVRLVRERGVWKLADFFVVTGPVPKYLQ